jgi:hypothetical protein
MCCANCGKLESYLRRPKKTIIFEVKKDLTHTDLLVMMRRSDETEKTSPGEFEIFDLTKNAEIVRCYSVLLNMVKFGDGRKFIFRQKRKLSNLVGTFTSIH